MCVIRRHFRWVRAVSRGNVFFAKYGGPRVGPSSQGETFFHEIRWPVRWVPLSGGGIIILRIIRRHFLAAAMDPAVSLSTYSPCPMEVVP